jgi:hypothetical protein
MSWFSCRTIGGVDKCDVAEFVPCASTDETEGWEAGTGPTMMGRMTEAGIGGIEDVEGAAEDASAVEVPLATCEVEVEDVGCTDVESVGPRDCDGTAEKVCCEVREGSTLTVGSDANRSAR